MRSRLAPTPSGKLHLGNIYNFILTWWHVRSNSGTLTLRIDDADELRAKREYIDNIFDTLEWLEIDLDDGPSSSEDFIQNYSQQKKKDYYLSKIIKRNDIFFCDCSRKKVNEEGHYEGKCFDKKRVFAAGEFAIRLNKAPYFPLLWRRDNIPAYHLTTLIDDDDLNITDLIRGKDLLPSSLIQKDLASILNTKIPAHVFHHKIITSNIGEKLSKTQGDKGVHEVYHNRQEVFDQFAGLLKIEKIVI